MTNCEIRYYTGVGARSAPQDILDLMKATAVFLRCRDWILRSGGAPGSDSAFAEGAEDAKIILRPKDAIPEAVEIASRFHGAWHLCSDYAKLLHGRNVQQVLGKDLKTPSKFLICWTSDGCTCHSERTVKTGGTGTAISVASYYKIPVFNLFHEKHVKMIKNMI